MNDHIHIITDGKRTPSETLRYLNGVTARRVIDFLKEGGYTESLAKLRTREKASRYKYSLWEHHSDKFIITSEEMFMQKLNYVHMNPVKGGLVEHPGDYLYSSFRWWNGKPIDGEPLSVDLEKLSWRER